MQIITGTYKSRKILAPKGVNTRPTSGRLRETLFNICRNIEGVEFLDLFAGSGAMGLEALSRGAKHATFIDNSRESIRCIQSNLLAFGINREGDVIDGDVFEAMKKLAKKDRRYDLIYADPPYAIFNRGISYSTQVLVILEELIDLNFPLLKSGGKLFLEDTFGTMSKDKIFKHFMLKDIRKMGRSLLQQWELREE